MASRPRAAAFHGKIASLFEILAAGHALSLQAVIRLLPNASGASNFGRVRFQRLLLVLPQLCQISATYSVPVWEH